MGVGQPESHIFGLGSGPKQEVLGRLLSERGDDAAAVFVEDRLLTLDKTMADEALRTKVLPVLAGWGYNTEEQRASASGSGCAPPHSRQRPLTPFAAPMTKDTVALVPRATLS